MLAASPHQVASPAEPTAPRDVKGPSPHHVAHTRPESGLEASLKALLEEELITGYTLFHGRGKVLMAGGSEHMGSPVLSRLVDVMDHEASAAAGGDSGAGLDGAVATGGEGRDAAKQARGGITHDGHGLVVIRKTLCDLLALSERRTVGIIAGKLPAHLTLAATFRRPVRPERISVEFFKVCDVLRG